MHIYVYIHTYIHAYIIFTFTLTFTFTYTYIYIYIVGNTCHILPPSEIDGGLFCGAESSTQASSPL